MNIFVYDVAAAEGGALSILRDFHEEVMGHPDKNIRWTFVLGKPELEGSANVAVRRFPWVKKSWLHRLWFDCFVCPGLVRQTRSDLIFSLQNIIVPWSKVPQILYVHQSLPYSNYRFAWSENKLLWIYQNIISKLIARSVRKAAAVVVQTRWMAEAIVKRNGIPQSKVQVIPPTVKTDALKRYEDAPENRKAFFYPASPHVYKNHELILEACRMLQRDNISDYTVVFTMDGTENAYAAKLLECARRDRLNIRFAGSITRAEVFGMYSRSVLVFPSLIETFGLPLLEARLAGSIILASDMPFSREILEGYANGYLFEASNPESLTGHMSALIGNRLAYHALSSNNLKTINTKLTQLIMSETP